MVNTIKLCECGCGQAAPIATKTQASQGDIKGQPKRFVLGHNRRAERTIPLIPPDENCRYIVLTRGKYTLVDASDYEWLSEYTWRTSKTTDSNTYYAIGHSSRKAGKRIAFLMHRMIMLASPGEQVDHIDGNGLNNRRNNLRICSNLENQYNKPMPSHNTSGYKGVSWHKNARKWRASIGYGKRHVHIGYFDSTVEAARAYDAAAIELYGEFAKLNFPDLEPGNV